MKIELFKLNEIKDRLHQFENWYRYKKELGADLSYIEQEAMRDFDKLIKRTKRLKEGITTAYIEPMSLHQIRVTRPKGPRILPMTLSQEELLNKIFGGWLGRGAGCVLGIPVEGFDKAQIAKFCEFIGQSYPLDDFFINIPFQQYQQLHYGTTPMNKFIRDQIEYLGADDDLAYTILNLVIIEKYGFKFTNKDVGKEWLDRLPIACTAEEVALTNLRRGIMPPKSARVDNPFAEWIGADIRSDIWGYTTPGLPELAAEFAYRDASVSHIKNGVYGAMFFSATISAAFVESDIDTLIEIGLSEIPANCRLAEAIRLTVQWYRDSGNNWEVTRQKIDDRYGYLHMADTIQNACFTILGLLHGKLDFTKTLAYTVMAGYDTDCTGATAGSILGIILGANQIPKKWYQRFNDRIISYVRGMEDNRISELAQRTLAVAQKVTRHYRKPGN
ncbi:MAG: ADP-ribosylglycohydrolase family protein [bacterium]|nr:ADP-ribosylglycohydrolase family protein [bacterium]